jgi:uncharacterized protein YeeX (DUF496 family)
MEEQNDHDNLVTLIANFKSLKESQDRFHQEVKQNFMDLKDNYSGRIDNHEVRIQDLEKTKIDPKEHEMLKEAKNSYFIMMVIYTSVGAAMIGIMLYHMFKQ